MIRFNDAHKDQELRYLGQEIMLTAQDKGPLTEAKIRENWRANRLLSRSGINLTMRKYPLDALIAPTGGPAWFTNLVNGDGGTASAPGPSTVRLGRRLSAHHRADGIRPRPACRPVVLRPRLERAHADQAGLRIEQATNAASAGVHAFGGTAARETMKPCSLDAASFDGCCRSRSRCVCGRNGWPVRSRAARGIAKAIELLPQLVKPTFICWDIGANTGTYTIALSRLAAKVITFERVPHSFATVREVVALARLQNVELHTLAMSDARGRARFSVPSEGFYGGYYLASFDAAGELEVETDAIDGLIARGLPEPDFIKCDVEGAEKRVIDGARGLRARRQQALAAGNV